MKRAKWTFEGDGEPIRFENIVSKAGFVPDVVVMRPVNKDGEHEPRRLNSEEKK